MLKKEDIARLAKAAHLHIEGQELEEMTEHLSGIMEYLSILEEVDTEGVEPLYSPLDDTPLRLREDEATPFPRNDIIIQNAPDMSDGYISVPKVLPKGS